MRNVATLFLLSAGPAAAHAMLQHAIPGVGSTVAQPPPMLTLVFSEGIEPRFSHVVVTDTAGRRVDRNDLHTAPGDVRRAMIDLATLPPGTYQVDWHVISVDTHRTQGHFTFTVSK